jgi:hypothetical protein
LVCSDMGNDLISKSVEGMMKQFFEAIWKFPTRFERLD